MAMASPDKFSKEQLNYFRICHVTAHVTDGLRKVFKQEWDARYKTSHGEWNDTAKNGIDFYSLTPPKEQKTKAKELSIIRNGNTMEWDCTCLFYAILYSKCIGKNKLDPKVNKAVDDLRQYRNNFAHTPKYKVTDADFQASVQDVISAFHDLNLDTIDIQNMKSQTSFHTEELEKIQEQLDKEKRRNQEPQTFCDLPPKPSHEVIPRSSEVDTITKEMKTLQSLHPNEVTHVYLSGNPGCGKSETARQIGENVFEKNRSASSPTFVATLNASSMDAVLSSYIKFARQLRLDEDYIQYIEKSKPDTKPEETILQVIGPVNKKLESFSSWLMIVDNVVDLKKSSHFFPRLGQNLRGRGQILITTQDGQSIPLASPKIYHKSLSKGMKPDDAVNALYTISHQKEDPEYIALQLARELDFQPLALVCTAVYMNLVSQHNSTYTWSKCLTKIQEGKLQQTEKPYLETSGHVYLQTMTTAVRIALDRVVKEDKIMMLTFEYLSVLAQDPIPIKYVVQYVQLFMPDELEELIEAHIARSSLVLCSDDSQDVRVHQIVHRILQETSRPTFEGDCVRLSKVIISFSHLNLSDNLSDDEAIDINFVRDTRSLTPHFTALVGIVQSNLQLFQTSKVLNESTRLAVAKCLSRSIGEACVLNGELMSSRSCFEISLALYDNNSSEAANIPILQNRLGEILYYLQEHSEAKLYFQQALIRFRCSSNDNDEIECSYYLRAVTNLALVLSTLEELREAERFVNKSIPLVKNCRNTPFIGKILNNLAMTYYNMNKVEEAKNFMHEALAIDQKRFGMEHPCLCERYNDLGLVLEKIGKHAEAKEYYELAIRIEETYHNKNNPYLAATLTNLGILLKDLRQYEEAKKCIERALAIDERIYDDNHPQLARDLNNLGLVLRDFRQYEEAKKCMERALAIDERIYDDNHPALATHLYNLAMVLQDLRQYEEAKKCMERAVAIDERIYDDSHPTLATVVGTA